MSAVMDSLHMQILSPVYTSNAVHTDYNSHVRFYICTIIYLGSQQLLFSISSAICAADK